MLKAILSLAEKVKANVIAEGIETQEELNTLLELGITYGQGFLFARPEPGFVHQQTSPERATTTQPVVTPSK
jgi:EAL domain-containing protein (putative c-di-GMP-specific phosphodiesterase class I)